MRRTFVTYIHIIHVRIHALRPINLLLLKRTTDFVYQIEHENVPRPKASFTIKRARNEEKNFQLKLQFVLGK